MIRDEKGQGLLEIVLSMPIYTTLLIAFGSLFAFGVRAYAFMLSDWQLQKEIQFAAERVIYDLSYAEDVQITPVSLRILCSGSSASPEWVAYRATVGETPEITRNTQPVTGDSILGNVKVEEFSFQKKESGQTVFFRIRAKNTLTGHEFAAESAVTYTGNES